MLVVAAIGAAVYAVRQRRTTSTPSSSPSAAPSWPPLEPRLTPPHLTDPVAAVRWVAPVDGACPIEHPIKANDNSRIFHVPGGRFYGRTIAERCYANADDAVADGYRAAKA